MGCFDNVSDPPACSLGNNWGTNPNVIGREVWDDRLKPGHPD